MNSKDIAEKHTILRVITGSTLYGTNTETSDKDEMGVCIEPVEALVGFTEFEQYINNSRDPETNKTVEDVKIYSLRKFLRLALQGNPDVIPVLFAPEKFHTVSHAIGRQLQDLTPHIVSRRCGARFLGYMESQRQRILGERGQKKVNRPELMEKYGFDTKYAMQVLRLGFQGRELLATGRISLPMEEDSRLLLRAVRSGEVSLQQVLETAGSLEREVKDLLTASPLSEHPNTELVEDWMITRYYESWKADRFMSDRLDLLGKGIH